MPSIAQAASTWGMPPTCSGIDLRVEKEAVRFADVFHLNSLSAAGVTRLSQTRLLLRRTLLSSALAELFTRFLRHPPHQMPHSPMIAYDRRLRFRFDRQLDSNLMALPIVNKHDDRRRGFSMANVTVT